MADKAIIELIDIENYAHGADNYDGIQSVSVSLARGPLRVSRSSDSVELPDQVDRDPLTRPPVTINPSGRSTEYGPGLLMAAEADVVITSKIAGGGGSTKLITITDVNYQTGNLGVNQSPGGRSTAGVTGIAVSADGVALPISIDDPV